MALSKVNWVERNIKMPSRRSIIEKSRVMKPACQFKRPPKCRATHFGPISWKTSSHMYASRRCRVLSLQCSGSEVERARLSARWNLRCEQVRARFTYTVGNRNGRARRKMVGLTDEVPKPRYRSFPSSAKPVSVWIVMPVPTSNFLGVMMEFQGGW